MRVEWWNDNYGYWFWIDCYKYGDSYEYKYCIDINLFARKLRIDLIEQKQNYKNKRIESPNKLNK